MMGLPANEFGLRFVLGATPALHANLRTLGPNEGRGVNSREDFGRSGPSELTRIVFGCSVTVDPEELLYYDERGERRYHRLGFATELNKSRAVQRQYGTSSFTDYGQAIQSLANVIGSSGVGPSPCRMRRLPRVTVALILMAIAVEHSRVRIVFEARFPPSELVSVRHCPGASTWLAGSTGLRSRTH